MSKAIIVATGDLDHLPREIQTVTNELSAAGWTVRLCIGPDASRMGLLTAAGEGDIDLAWFGLHSSADGFALSDGMWPPSQLGVWLRNVNACELVLNSCYGIEHVNAIQRAAESCGVTCAIDPAGVDDALAWQVGVYLVRSFIASDDMRKAVQEASARGELQYRYVPAGGLVIGGSRRMPADRIEEQLQQLLRALYGENANAVPGLVMRVGEIQTSLRQMADEQQRWHEEQRDWRSDVERRLGQLERPKPVVVSERSVYVASVIIVLLLAGLLAAVMMFNGRFG